MAHDSIIMGRTIKMKVSATNSALNLLSELKERYGEKLMFHQSGGCCDGSAPMCFQEGEFPLGDNDIKLGEIGGVPFYMNGDQYEKWKHTDLTIDAVKGIGGMFSLDNGTGKRFLTRSRVYEENEINELLKNPPQIASNLSNIEGLKTTVN